MLTHERRVVSLLIQRARAADGVVERVLGEGLHGGATAAGLVAVGVNRIEGAIVVEHLCC